MAFVSRLMFYCFKVVWFASWMALLRGLRVTSFQMMAVVFVLFKRYVQKCHVFAGFVSKSPILSPRLLLAMVMSFVSFISIARMNAEFET